MPPLIVGSVPCSAVAFLNHIPLARVVRPFRSCYPTANANDYAAILVRLNGVLVKPRRFIWSGVVANAIILVKEADGMRVRVVLCQVWRLHDFLPTTAAR